MRENYAAVRRRDLEHVRHQFVIQPVSVHGRKQADTAQSQFGKCAPRTNRCIRCGSVQYEETHKTIRVLSYSARDRFLVARYAGDERRSRHFVPIQLLYPSFRQRFLWTGRLPPELAGNPVGRDSGLLAILFAAKRLEKAGRKEMAVAIVKGHRSPGPSKAVLKADERRDLVAKSVLVESEKEVDVQEQPVEQVRLEASRAAQCVERVTAEHDVREHRVAV